MRTRSRERKDNDDDALAEEAARADTIMLIIGMISDVVGRVLYFSVNTTQTVYDRLLATQDPDLLPVGRSVLSSLSVTEMHNMLHWDYNLSGRTYSMMYRFDDIPILWMHSSRRFTRNANVMWKSICAEHHEDRGSKIRALNCMMRSPYDFITRPDTNDEGRPAEDGERA